MLLSQFRDLEARKLPGNETRSATPKKVQVFIILSLHQQGYSVECDIVFCIITVLGLES